jgi:hypothetical protein
MAVSLERGDAKANAVSAERGEENLSVSTRGNGPGEEGGFVSELDVCEG